MKHYIISVTLCAILSSVICIASPKNGGIDRFIKFISTLIVTSVVLLPVANLEITEFQSDDLTVETPSSDHYKETASKSIAMSLSATIEIKIGKNSVKQVDVELSDEKDFDIKEITVYIKSSYKNTVELEKELSELYNCKISIREK